MVVSDPIADFLIRIKNAAMVGKSEVRVPYSKIKHTLADLLVERGYLESAEKVGKKAKKELVVTVKYTDGTPSFEEIKRISKPSRRIYIKSKDIFPIKYGKGTLVISTSKGIMTGEKAKEENLGGEALFEIY